jgi:hypothetical protein
LYFYVLLRFPYAGGFSPEYIKKFLVSYYAIHFALKNQYAVQNGIIRLWQQHRQASNTSYQLSAISSRFLCFELVWDLEFRLGGYKKEGLSHGWGLSPFKEGGRLLEMISVFGAKLSLPCCGAPAR